MDRSRLVVIALLLSIFVGFAVLYLVAAPGGGGRSTTPVIAVIVAVAAAGVAVVVIARVQRARARAPGKSTAEAAAARLGLAYARKGERGFHHRFGPLPGIPRQGDVRHVLEGDLDGRPITICQHTYVINTGQAVVPVHHTVYVVDAPQWPRVAVSRRRLLGRILYQLGRRTGLLLEDESFNRTMKVRTDDEDFALTLLHPEMQQFLAGKPGVTWCLQAGHCAMIYGGALKVDRVDASLERLQRFLALVPEELDAW